MTSNLATIYIFPSALHPEDNKYWVNDIYKNNVLSCQIIFCETAKQTRRFLKSILPQIDLNNLEIIDLKNKHEEAAIKFKQALATFQNIGIFSDAGCPILADPGQILIDIAQQNKCTVVPMVGPSSIYLSLMGSGFSGQQFHFHGYLPIQSHLRIHYLKKLQTQCTHIFIETPYRNEALFSDIIKNLPPQRLLCLGIEIHSLNQRIITRSIDKWQASKIDLKNKQVIFLIA